MDAGDGLFVGAVDYADLDGTSV